MIKHLYIERRLKPLNLYLMSAEPAEKARVVRDYGLAIKELAAANIFPGDMLFKNFGVTRYGRVIFYDYDEIEYLSDCRFRRIPEAPYPEMEMSGEVWYPVARNDVFPEEFGAFLLGDAEVRQTFLRHHQDLLSPAFWQQRQSRIGAGHIEDFYPYPEEMRFINAYPRFIGGSGRFARSGIDARKTGKRLLPRLGVECARARRLGAVAVLEVGDGPGAG